LCFAGAVWGAVVNVTPHSQVAISIERRFIMASYNKVILMGHLTRNPELRTLPNSGTTVCDFGLAVNRRWKDANGGDREEVLFIDCAAFGKVGQTIGETLTKGRPVHIDGRLRLEQWQQEDGQRRSKIRVVVDQFRFVDRKPADGQPAQRDGRGNRRNSKSRPQQRPMAGPAQAAPAQPTPADIPF
jgi:single-strand DNA-binding protein